MSLKNNKSLSFRTFFTQLSIFSLIALGALVCYQEIIPIKFKTDFFLIIWLFFTVTTALIHIVLIRTTLRDPKKFITYFMGITGVKLFCYLIAIIIYGLVNRETVLGFTACFLLTYLLYSVFEIITLTRYFRK